MASAASWECPAFTCCHSLSQLDDESIEVVKVIAIAWPSLLPRIREMIASLASLDLSEVPVQHRSDNREPGAWS